MNRRLVLQAKSTPMVIETAPIPDPPENGLVIKVRYAGICHSDVHIYHQSMAPVFVYPRVLGHEVSGEVHSVGSTRVDGAEEFKVGERVALYPWGGCRKCEVCLSGSQHCQSRGTPAALTYGIIQDGGYEEFMVIHDSHMVIHVPEGIPLDVACLLPCSGLTAYNAICQLDDTLRQANKERGKAVVVIAGAGGVGLWAVRLIKAVHTLPLTVCVVDVADDKLQEAIEAGADLALNWNSTEGSVEEIAEQLKQTCGGTIDGAIDFVGIPTTFRRIQLSLKYNATLVLVGLHGGPMPQMEIRHIAQRNLRIQGIFVGSKGQTDDLFELVAKKKIHAPPLTHVTIEDVNGVIESLSKGTQIGRAIVKFE